MKNTIYEYPTSNDTLCGLSERTLKKKAILACNPQHIMGKFRRIHRFASISECKICGCVVYVDTNPNPSHPMITGSAIREGCKRK